MTADSILKPFRITLVNDGIFPEMSKMMNRDIKKKALNRGAHRLKETIKETFVRMMPAANRPLTSKYNGRRWKGKLVDVVRQGTPIVTDHRGITNVHLLGSRRSGYGDFIGIFYNKGNFRSPDRKGKRRANREFRAGKKISNKIFYRAMKAQNFKATDRNYHSRGDLPALYFLREGARGFKFTDTVEAVLREHIEKLHTVKAK